MYRLSSNRVLPNIYHRNISDEDVIPTQPPPLFIQPAAVVYGHCDVYWIANLLNSVSDDKLDDNNARNLRDGTMQAAITERIACPCPVPILPAFPVRYRSRSAYSCSRR